MPATPKTYNGFTLIELLVVITIIGLLSGAGLLAFSKTQAQQQLDKAYLQVKTDLHEAREYAFLSKKPTESGKTSEEICPNLDGYIFKITSSTTYVIYAKCGTNLYEIKPVTLDAGISLSPASSEFMFATLTRTTGLDPALSLTLSNKAGNTKAVTIDSSGEINDVEE